MADLRSDEFMNHALRDWEDMVYRLALSQTREPADASDVCQETFISLLKDATVFQDDEHLKAWLIRVTINRCNQLRRTASRHRTQPLPDDETLLPKTPPASAALMANEVWRVLDTLPPKYRAVVHLHYVEGYSTEEIDLERSARLALDDVVALNIALFLHDAGYLDKFLAGRHGHRRLAGRVSVTHARKHICNGVGHGHSDFLLWSVMSLSIRFVGARNASA